MKRSGGSRSDGGSNVDGGFLVLQGIFFRMPKGIRQISRQTPQAPYDSTESRFPIGCRSGLAGRRIGGHLPCDRLGLTQLVYGVSERFMPEKTVQIVSEYKSFNLFIGIKRFRRLAFVDHFFNGGFRRRTVLLECLLM